ncbi:MAG: prepilin peptidase [Alphaproteobacteria bacterium]|nr:prepilin peptidase [Alphaproteobacteria bacterium]
MLVSLISVIYCIINVIIAVYDFSFFRIPNLLLAMLLGIYIIVAPFYISLEDISSSLIIFAVVLIISFALFSFKFIGGGDAKYIAVSSLWVGAQGILPFLLIVSIIGGALALPYLFLKDHMGRCSDWVWIQIQKAETRYSFLQYVWAGSGIGPEMGKRENISSRMIPYGIAIAGGSILMMVYEPLLTLMKG